MEWGTIKEPDELIATYSRLTKDSVLTKSVDEFLVDADKLEGNTYKKTDCAGLISQSLETYASYTGMTQIHDHDAVYVGAIDELGGIQNVPVGAIIGQKGRDGDPDRVDHGGIIVMHDFNDGRGSVKAIYHSRSNELGGPAYVDLYEGAWNIWIWHDGVTR